MTLVSRGCGVEVKAGKKGHVLRKGRGEPGSQDKVEGRFMLNLGV